MREPTVSSSALVVDGLGKSYGERVALDEVTLEVARGQRVMLVGPNGSGKSTLLRVVAGLLEATSGEARILGARSGSMEARAVTAFVGDDPVLYDDLSVLEHCEYLGRLHGISDVAERAGYVLERLGLSARADQLPSSFSRGLRQKSALAIAFVRPFRLLLVDEPFVGLDTPGRNALQALLDEAAQAGAAVVVATHQGEALEWADRLVGLQDGGLAYDGEPTSEALRRLVGA